MVYRKSGLERNVFADFANDSTESKSIKGVMTLIGKNLIDWQSSKQSLVALSTCEAETTAIVKGTRSAIYMKGLLKDMMIKGMNVNRGLSFGMF